MATIDDVARLATALPDVTEGLRWNNRTWFVGGKGFVWERPFSKADIKRFGTDPVPSGPIAAVWVGDLDEKEAVLAAGTKGVFTIEHFKGYPAVLLQLDKVTKKALTELISDGWLAAAPAKLSDEYLSRRRRR
ncbi:MAG: MmcQ/YjbR family DNA-binding protein [Acidimicrobiia bacterium]